MLHFNVKKKENMAAGRIELPFYSVLTARGEKSDSASLFGASLVTVVRSHQQVMQLVQFTHLQLLHMHKQAVDPVVSVSRSN